MAAGSGLFDSGPVVARYSLSTDVRPLRGALSSSRKFGRRQLRWYRRLGGSLMEPLGASRDEAREAND